MGNHIIGGEFQSDKYPTCPRGKFPMSFKDPMAQDLILIYAQRRRVVDAELSEDMESCLMSAGYMVPDSISVPTVRTVADIALSLKDLKDEWLLQFFKYDHLPAHLQKVAVPFTALALDIVEQLPRNPERTVALRKLLEAKDCAVRALIGK